MNHFQWSAVELKRWITYYIQYHNTVIYTVGNSTGQGGSEEPQEEAQNITTTQTVEPGFMGALQSIGQSIGNAAGEVWDATKQAAGAVGDWFSQMAGYVADFF